MAGPEIPKTTKVTDAYLNALANENERKKEGRFRGNKVQLTTNNKVPGNGFTPGVIPCVPGLEKKINPEGSQNNTTSPLEEMRALGDRLKELGPLGADEILDELKNNIHKLKNNINTIYKNMESLDKNMNNTKERLREFKIKDAKNRKNPITTPKEYKDTIREYNDSVEKTCESNLKLIVKNLNHLNEFLAKLETKIYGKPLEAEEKHEFILYRLNKKYIDFVTAKHPTESPTELSSLLNDQSETFGTLSRVLKTAYQLREQARQELILIRDDINRFSL